MLRRPTALPSSPALARFWLAVAVLAIIGAACGADADPDGEEPAVLPDRLQVADVRFDGLFQVTAVTIDGGEIELISVPVIEIESQFGGLEVMPGCNTYFGSFTLAEDGAASFTIPGGSSSACDELGDQERAVLAGLAAAVRWEETDTGFRFVADNGDQVTITR